MILRAGALSLIYFFYSDFACWADAYTDKYIAAPPPDAGR